MENNNKLTLKQKVLAHYDRMIEWAKTQEPFSPAYSGFMHDDLKEDWYGGSCPLCSLFYYDEVKNDGDFCKDCPVSKKTGKADCAGSPHYKMNRVANWEEWIAAALEERAFLESLDYGEETACSTNG